MDQSAYYSKSRTNHLGTRLFPLALLLATPLVAQVPTAKEAEDIIRTAYAEATVRSMLPLDGFYLTVDGFSHYTINDLDGVPRQGFVSLPEAGYITGRLSYLGGELLWTPSWQQGDPSTTPQDFGDDTVQTLLQLAATEDSVWTDVVAVTRYAVSLHLKDIDLTYNAAVFWLPPAGGETYGARFVDWVLQDLPTILAFDASAGKATEASGETEGAVTEQCVPQEYGPFSRSFAADDLYIPAETRDHRWGVFPPAYHWLQAEAEVACSCDADCHQKCDTPVTINPFACGHSFPSPTINYPYHVKSQNYGLALRDRFVQGGGCQIAVKCAFRGCQHEACAFSVGVRVALEMVTFTLSPNDNIVWDSPDLSWDMECPACTRLFSIGGTVQGQIPPDGSVTLIYDPTAGDGAQQEVTVSEPGGFLFPERGREGETYIIRKQEQCTSCQLANASGTVTGPVNDIAATCQAVGCSKVGFHLAFETPDGEPSTMGGQLLARLAYDPGAGTVIEPMNVSQPGTYEFPPSLNQGTTWVVDAQALPPPVQACSVTNGEGQAGSGGTQYANILCTVEAPAGGDYSVSVTINQASPLGDSVVAVLEAGPAGGGLEHVETRELGPGNHSFTFLNLLPDGYQFKVSATTDSIDETCNPRVGTINGSDVSVTIACSNPPDGPGGYRGPREVLVDDPNPLPPGGGGGAARRCAYTYIEYETYRCGTNNGIPMFCTRLRVHCFQVAPNGQLVSGPSMDISVPEADGPLVRGIDESLPVTASATHADGLAGFTLRLDGDPLADYPASGSPTSMPLPVSSIDASGLDEGEHLLGIVAFGGEPTDLVATAIGVAFEVDHQGGGGGGSDTSPPTVVLVSPPNQAELPPGTVLVTASAADASGIARIEFFRNGIGQGVRHTDTTPPYTWAWQATEGVHALQVRAVDASPNANTALSAQHYVHIVSGAPPPPPPPPPGCGDTTPPVVALTAPSNGSTHDLGVPMTVAASATDDVGVTKVEFYRDGSTLLGTRLGPPLSIIWTPQQTGNHDLTAKAYDACDNFATSPVRTVHVVNNPCSGDTTGPSVTITAPPEGSQHQVELPFTIAADASDPNGVSEVEFYVDAAGVVGTDQTAPYSASWTPPRENGIEGEHMIAVTGTDGCGNTTTVTRTISVECRTCGGPLPPPVP